jgi:acetoin utilization deacetylase AcuC-like enzyme
LFFSAGFDARKDDEVCAAGLLCPSDYQELTTFMCRLFPGIPVVSALEGGYGTSNFVECVQAHIFGLMKRKCTEWIQNDLSINWEI